MDTLIIDDLSRSCSSQLDKACLYGDPGVNPDEPRGIVATPNVHQVAIDWSNPVFDDFLERERLIEIENVGLSTYALIMNPDSRKILRGLSHWSAGYGDRSIWEALTNTISSNVVNDSKVFFGEWKQLIIGI